MFAFKIVVSFNVYKTDGSFYAFNLGAFTTGAILDPAANRISRKV
jgi:hypothetical protein